VKPFSDYIARNLKYALPRNWRAGAKAVYRRLSKSGVLFEEDELGMASLHPSCKATRIVELTKPATVIDFGCGTGCTLEQFVEMGLDAVGIEASSAAIRASKYRHLIKRQDLRRRFDLGRRFDLAWCFEVAEHIHPQYVEVFIDNLCRHSDLVTLSAAPPGQGGEGHFNEQPQAYWVERFSSRGYWLHEEWSLALRVVPEHYSENMMVFIANQKYSLTT
jgi:SAM-dependent methyltransferase